MSSWADPVRSHGERGNDPHLMGDRDVVMTDGPFVEAKEHIAGFYVINADDPDAALAWGRKVVDAIRHPIEVRPFRATGRVQA
jgi:hypothetical protein